MADGTNWTNYSEYNKTVRAWFVALGIGGPVTILANPTLLDAMKPSGLANCVVTAFFAAVACQILIAVINKTVALQLAFGDDDDPVEAARYKTTCPYQVADRVSNWWYLDVGADLLSMILFGYALYHLANTGLSLAVGAFPIKH